MANISSFHPNYFLLMGIPGLEESHRPLSVVLFNMYVVALAGNIILIFVISANESLHQPMYIFLAGLAVGDLLMSSSTVPKALGIFWFSAHEISFSGCLTQIFFIHFSSLLDSGILFAMAYDRYVAICHPLIYTKKLTTSFIRNVLMILVARNFVMIIPFPILAWRLPYRASVIIEHTYCEHMGVARLATASIRVNVIYGLMIIAFGALVDMILIGLSYAAIIRAIIRLKSSEARHKAFNTCGSHLCVLASSYIPAYFSFITHRIPHHHIPPYVHILVANMYVIVPPMMNPIIYGVRTKEINQRVFKMFSLM
ncbi:olfactory receptor 52E4-like [Gastrophryne carolinensis]